MAHAKYRSPDDPKYEEISIDLDLDVKNWLEQTAIEKDITVDEVVECILQEMIKQQENV